MSRPGQNRRLRFAGGAAIATVVLVTACTELTNPDCGQKRGQRFTQDDITQFSILQGSEVGWAEVLLEGVGGGPQFNACISEHIKYNFKMDMGSLSVGQSLHLVDVSVVVQYGEGFDYERSYRMVFPCDSNCSVEESGNFGIKDAYAEGDWGQVDTDILMRFPFNGDPHASANGLSQEIDRILRSFSIQYEYREPK